jgi:haloacid dehalogenase-like hydrolase
LLYIQQILHDRRDAAGRPSRDFAQITRHPRRTSSSLRPGLGFRYTQGLAKLLAIPLAEIAVIGDGGNDVAMFERSGLSIAMGNAKPEVRQAADFVTNSNDDDGFANAMERFILGGHRSNASAKADRGGVSV